MPETVRAGTRRREANGAAKADVTMTVPRRLLGLGIIVLGGFPIYRLLDRPETGLAGSSTVAQLNTYFDMMWSGMLLMVPLFLIGARLLPGRFNEWIAGAGQKLAAIPRRGFAAGVGLLAGVFGMVFVLAVLDGLPNLIDAHAQLLHARFWASGQFAGPVSDGGGFWAMQNSVFTERGWVSQYPPGHVAVLALFMRLGVPWLAGPLLMAVTVAFAALFADRLLADRPATARLGALLLVVSPFFIAIGASYMNHISAAAGISVGAYALLRAWQGRAIWGLLAGASFAFALTSRPLSAVAMAAALTLLIPFTAPAAGRGRICAQITAWMTAGAAPLVAMLMAYNAYFYGSPFTFGYNVALGPRMSLGFHMDPWGNQYGVAEAVGYTSADLLTLGLNLLESPLSAVLVVGLFLLVAPRVSPAVRVLVGWAMAPLATNFFYWHHGLFMGPRMLHEAAPAWLLLFAVAIVSLIQLIPAPASAARLRLRTGVATMAVGGIALSLVLLGPQRLISYGGGWNAVMRTAAPAVSGLAIVFVHDAWGSRISATLASHGYRLDVVETLLRQNSTCSVHRLSAAVTLGDAGLERALYAGLDTVPRTASALPTREISPSNRIRVAPGERLTAECEREAASDARGNLALEPLLWRGAAPGSRTSGVHYVRDLGPERNALLIAQHPGYELYVYTTRDAEGLEPVLLPYHQAMAALWGSSVVTLGGADNGAAN
jgi:hypothetical protein